MTTVNISLPVQLKSQADLLISSGHYASFSDLVRSALRQLFTSHIDTTDYDAMLKEALADQAAGRTIVMTTPKEIDDFLIAEYNKVSDEKYRIKPKLSQRVPQTRQKQSVTHPKNQQNSSLSLA
jgi:Arc/MetJ-type ribon-helix-helix transcriptional regulator